MLLELAYFSQADYIVTGLYFSNKMLMSEANDKDLLVLDGESFEDYTFNIIEVGVFLKQL